jgi:hypothetical protein
MQWRSHGAKRRFLFRFFFGEKVPHGTSWPAAGGLQGSYQICYAK